MKKLPPSRLIDITGQQFERLTVIKRVPNKGKNARWLCKCSCGNYIEVDGCHLKNGGTKSCGCIVKEAKWNKTHGMSKSRLYEIWHGIKRRCLGNNKNYSGRGIKICQQWRDNFSNFYNWAINNGYSSNLTIDRIDNNGDYCPENCRWATNKEQANNKRTNVFVEYNGIAHTVSEWSDILGIRRSTLEKRLKTKSIKDSFEKEIAENKSHPLNFEDWENESTYN